MEVQTLRVRYVRRTAGKASSYILPFNISPGRRVILCLRVSRRAQRCAGNLADQREALRAAVQRAGGVLVGIVLHTGHGTDPGWLAPAANLARLRGAMLLAESTDRFIRTPDYHSVDCPDAQAGEGDLARLAAVTEGCRLMTMLDPDAPPTKVRSYQRQRGQERKARRGGRGNRAAGTAACLPGAMKRRRKTWLRHVLSMHRAGASLGEISRGTGISKMTCHNWISFWS